MTFEPVFINFEAQQESAGALLQENKEKNEGYKPGRSQNFPTLRSKRWVSGGDLESLSSVNRWEEDCGKEETFGAKTTTTNSSSLNQKLHIQLKDALTVLGKVFGERGGHRSLK